MLDVQQFRALIVRPTLEALTMYSEAAENLLVGTALIESGLRYLHQLGGGPALGLYQMEPATHDDLSVNFLRFRPDIALSPMLRPRVAERLVWDLRYATAMARVHYFRDPESLPAADDLPGLASYWKRVYNTRRGKGNIGKFIEIYRKHGGSSDGS